MGDTPRSGGLIVGKISWVRAILSGLIGMMIGAIFIAIANMVSPNAYLLQVLVVVCVPCFLSGATGNILGARPRKADRRSTGGAD
jgi:hypothetical protein